MPNGFIGSNEEWDRLEAPLREIDPIVTAFADRHGMVIEYNYHNWPNRHLVWGDSLRRAIQIVRSTGEPPLYSVHLAASEWRTDGHFVKQSVVAKGLDLAALKTGLERRLEKALSEVSSWTSADLEPSSG